MDTNELYTRTVNYARSVARGRLPDDDVVSDAGLAVTIALQKVKYGRVFTFACHIVRAKIIDALKARRRHRQRSDFFWVNRIAPAGEVAAESVAAVTKEACAAAGATIDEIQERFGVSRWTARRVVREARKHART